MWWSKFLSGIYEIPYKVMMLVRSNPMGIFIYGILANWYVVIVIGGVMVAYWVLKGLEETGILSSAFNTLTEAISHSKAIAQNCTPKILNIDALWNCISEPGTYKQAPGEAGLNDIANQVNDIVNKKTTLENPYEDNTPSN